MLASLQRIRYLMQKEFRQIFREKANLVIIFLMPFIQIVILGSAITMDIKNIRLAVLDQDHSVMSQNMIRTFEASKTFMFEGVLQGQAEAVAALDRGTIKVAVIVPPHFSEHILRAEPTSIQVLLDAVDGNSAGISMGYISQLLSEFQKTLTPGAAQNVPQIVLKSRMIYNPNLESRYNIIPGIVALLLTMVTLFLTAINVVKEKERGTLEQLLVTPIRGPELILGKTLPFAILGFLMFNVGLLATGLFFNIWLKGSLLLLYGISILFMMTTLGVGILFSSIAKNQQQAMLMAWFFSIFSILLSGFFVPVENMPDIIQQMTYLNPLRYFIQVTRGIYLKGSDAMDLLPQAAALAIFGFVIFTVAGMSFRKRMK